MVRTNPGVTPDHGAQVRESQRRAKQAAAAPVATASAATSRTPALLFDPCRCGVGDPSGGCLTCRRWDRYYLEVQARIEAALAAEGLVE